jgi:ornithine carbamoyltransferase
MKSFIRLTDYTKSELLKIFQIADTVEKYNGFLQGKTIVMFFPASSIRTRVTFEKGYIFLEDKPYYLIRQRLIKKKISGMYADISKTGLMLL